MNARPLLTALLCAFCIDFVQADSPNVLFIAVDDLNHWVGHLKRNDQTITPNLDRLAKKGTSFARAYCAAPACNPSRAALMSGMRPSTTGVYHNPNPYRPYVKPEQTLNSHFRANGYYVAGAGKIYHGGGGRREEWDDYGGGPGVKGQGAFEKGAVGKLAWAQLKGGDEVVRDYQTVSYCIDQLKKKHAKPFFLACGIFRPHLPWNVPKKYFDMHPLENIKLPPYQEDDLKDVPPAGVKTAGSNGDHRKVREAGKWKELVRAYLASVTFADAMLGRLLDAYDQSEHANNTIIVLWGDHGWHLGEKHHWRKFALWEEATRAPLIWVAPGVTTAGTICETPVDFMSIYPTLCDLASLKKPGHLDGVSILPLLKDPKAKWDRPAMTTHGRGRHALRSPRWRYIVYGDGQEELYDHSNDEYEWKNVAAD
ncbi:MAG: sulfatase, partial [Planctomycetota bacterium]